MTGQAAGGDSIKVWRTRAPTSRDSEALQGRGVHITVVSTVESRPPMVADELRRQADVFIDLLELRPKISREQRPPDHR